MDTTVKKTHFVRTLKERLLLRFHMFLILFGTALAGLLASKVLLQLDVTNIVIRYPVTVIISYLVFFGFIKLWLTYIMTLPAHRAYDTGDAALDAITNIPDVSLGGLPGRTAFSGGGGTFDGAGAVGSFDAGSTIAADTPAVLADAAAKTGEGAGGVVGDAAGEAASGIVEEAGWILVVLGTLLAIVFGAGIYLVYDAPFILSEAAFDFVLAAGLLKSSRKIDTADWKGSVLRTTWKPFLVVLMISLVAAAVIHSFYPEAVKLSEILRG